MLFWGLRGPSHISGFFFFGEQTICTKKKYIYIWPRFNPLTIRDNMTQFQILSCWKMRNVVAFSWTCQKSVQTLMSCLMCTVWPTYFMIKCRLKKVNFSEGIYVCIWQTLLIKEIYTKLKVYSALLFQLQESTQKRCISTLLFQMLKCVFMLKK